MPCNKDCPYRAIESAGKPAGTSEVGYLPEFLVQCDLMDDFDGDKGAYIDEMESREDDHTFLICSMCEVPSLSESNKNLVPYDVQYVEGVVISLWLESKSGLLIDPHSGRLWKDIEVENMEIERLALTGGEQ